MEGSSTDSVQAPDPEQPFRFDTPNYERLLRRLIDENREFVDFDARGDGVLLHHDVELSLDRALTMARLETTLRIGATYCVPLDSPLHDTSIVTLARTVQTISQLGHTVGLQFDPWQHWDELPGDATLRSRIAAEREVLARLLDEPIPVVSFRQPTDRLRALELDDAINACRSSPDETHPCVRDHEWRQITSPAETIPDPARVLVHPGLWYPVERRESAVLTDLREAAYQRVDGYFDAFDIHESIE